MRGRVRWMRACRATKSEVVTFEVKRPLDGAFFGNYPMTGTFMEGAYNSRIAVRPSSESSNE